MKKMLLAAMVILVVCGALYLLLPKSEDETPAAENPAVECLPAPATPALQTAEQPFRPETNREKPTEENAALRLPPAAHTYLPAEQTQPEASYYRTKNDDERTIAPGVTYKRGAGISVKVDEDEKIEIRRDSTYRSGEYQIRWKKSSDSIKYTATEAIFRRESGFFLC